uniref:DUF4283 domain-containing protein n=1 Tax=Cannabis sativa TaxID=3483 RepID=A0A803PSS8_CANSA
MASRSRVVDDLGNRWANLTVEEEEEEVRNVMASLWRPEKGMALEGTPWTFNKIPLIIERLKEGDNPRSCALNTMEIWVQFYHRLFDEPLESIVKPYGLFMKAPNRRQGRQIGARWLRDSMGKPVEGLSDDSSAAGNSQMSRRTNPRIMEMDVGSSGNQGVINLM